MAGQIDPKTGESIPSGGQIDPNTGESINAQLGNIGAQITKPSNVGQYLGQTAKGLGVGAAKGAGSSLNAIGSAMIPDRLVKAVGATPPTAEQKQSYFAPKNTSETVGKGLEQAGEFLIPGGGEEALAAKASEHLPSMMAPFAKAGATALGSGAVNKLQGGSFGTGALAGAGGSLVGQGLKAAAPALAETAMRVRGNDRMFGRTVGEGILNDTKGVLPGTVAKSAQSKIGELTPQLEQTAGEASQRGATGSLLPARIGTAQTMAKHINNYAPGSAAELEPLEQRLATNPRTGQPFAENQSPSELMRMKRGLNSDFIQNWRPDQPPGLRSSAREAYGNLANEFHNAAPGTKELDQRISSLMPVVNRAETAERGPGLLQRTAGRLGAHTGALIGGGLGAESGYRAGGLPGALAGGAAGILLPEMLSSPTAQMIGARALNRSVPNFFAPAIRGAALQADRKEKR